MMDGDYGITVTCPWCGRGETLADKPAAVNLSCRCYECGHFYHIDLEHKRGIRAKPPGPCPKARSPNRRAQYNN